MEETKSQSLIKKILSSNLTDENDTSYIVYDLDLIDKRYKELKSAFPENTLHGIAIKACPLPAILKKQAESGLGAEAASIEEVQIALKSGISSEKITFDGPPKTKSEILFCIKNNIYINMDSFEEQKIVEKLNNFYSSSTNENIELRKKKSRKIFKNSEW